MSARSRRVWRLVGGLFRLRLGLFQQPGGEGCQIVVHPGARGQIAQIGQTLAFAGAHQMQPAPQRLTGLQITHAVAHRRHALEILKLVATGDVLEQAGLGFAAAAVIFRRVRAEENGVDAPAYRRQRFVHFAMDGVERAHVEQAPPNARLIGGHRHMPALVVQPGNGLQAAGNGHPLVGRLDEIVAVLVDDAVAVEDEQFHAVIVVQDGSQAARRDKSATWFIASCSRANRARRLARSAGSSALTITWSKKVSTGTFSAASILSAAV